MSKVVTTTVLPDVAGGSVTLGGTGDNVVVTGNDLRANVLQDAGGNAVLTSNGSGVLSGMNSGFGGALNLIQSQTVSNQASVSFTTGIDSTYDVYIFKFVDVNPATDQAYFTFQVNATDGADYNDSLITSTVFRTYHSESGDDTSLAYRTGEDQAQAAGFQNIAYYLGNGADESCAGELHLFGPSSTTFVKHFYSRAVEYYAANYLVDYYAAGYINDTTAINAVQFKMSTGNFDGTIKMYGISKS